MSSNERWRQSYSECLAHRSPFKVADWLGNSFLVTRTTSRDLIAGLAHVVDPIKNLSRFRCKRINIHAAEYALYTSYHISTYKQFVDDLDCFRAHNYNSTSEVYSTLLALYNMIQNSRSRLSVKNEIRLAFSDFLTAGNLDSSIVIAGLQEHNTSCSIVMPTEASIIVYNVYTNFHKWLNRDSARVYWTNEMDAVDADYANASLCPANCFDSSPHVWYPGWLSCVHLDGMRSSYYGRRFSILSTECVPKLSRSRVLSSEMTQPRAANLSAVISNGKEERLTLLRLLEEAGLSILKGGRCFNAPVTDKISFIKNADLNACFENTIKPGYITEKIIDSYHSGCVPLYWSGGVNAHILNQDAYIDVSDFRTPEELALKILNLSPAELLEIRRSPLFAYEYDVAEVVSRVGGVLSSLG